MRKSIHATRPSDLQLDLLLALFDGPLTSGELVAAVTDLRQREVPLATFYRQLQRTVDLGWVQVVDATDDVGGPKLGRPERCYGVSSAGTTVLRSEMKHFHRRIARAESSGLLTERTP